MRSLPLSLLILTCLHLFAVSSWAEGIIRDIRVRGLQSVEEIEILDRLQSAVGQPLDMALVRADQRTIINMGIFDPASIRVDLEEIPGTDDVVLIFGLRENPVVSGIEITGNLNMDSGRIESIIPQRVGERHRSQALREGRLGILDHYRRDGHADVRVQMGTERQPDGSVIILVDIDEGMALVIEDLFIEGNENVSDRRIRGRMVTKPGGIFGDNHYHDILFEQDLREVEGYLFERGYLDAQVERGELHRDGLNVSPTIIIEEGPRYTLGAVTVVGNTLYTDLEITSRFDNLTGEWFDAEDLREKVGDIKELLGDEGHINAVVDPRLSPDRERGAVDVLLVISEGPRIVLGSIYLQRTTHAPGDAPDDLPRNPIRRWTERMSPPVDQEVIRRVITLEEGEVYRRYEEVESHDEMRRLRIFDDLDLHRRPTSDPTVEDLIVTVDQDVTGFLGIGVGYGDESGLFGQIHVVESNFQGEADRIRASIRAGTSVFSFNVQYFNRFLGDTDRSLLLSAHAWEYGRSEYDERRIGGGADLGIPVSDIVDLTLGARSEHVSFDLDNPASAATTAAMDSYILGLASVGLNADRRRGDEWWTDGWAGKINLEGGWADDWLVRLNGEWDQYVPITEDLVFALHLMGGVIPNDREDIAFGERFFLGGSRDLRGFDFRGAGDVDSVNNALFIGGSTKVLAQSELQFPIFKSLRGVLFADIGALGDQPFELDDPRASVGGGIRWVIPGFGALGVDLAGAVLDEDTDETEVLHINFLSDF